MLGVTKSEAVAIIDQLDSHQKSQPEKPTMPSAQSTTEMTINSFLGCFEVLPADQSRSSSDKDEPSTSCSSVSNYVNLRKALSSEMKLNLGEFPY